MTEEEAAACTRSLAALKAEVERVLARSRDTLAHVNRELRERRALCERSAPAVRARANAQ